MISRAGLRQMLAYGDTLECTSLQYFDGLPLPRFRQTEWASSGREKLCILKESLQGKQIF